MNCKETRQILRQRFDEGGDLARELPRHVEACEACQAYAERLRALDKALMHLPVEIPSVQLLERVSATAKETPGTFSWPLPIAAAAMLVLTAGVLGWFYPIDMDPARVSAEARTWLAQVDLREWLTLVDPRNAGAFLLSQLRGAWDQCALQAGGYTGTLPPLFLWVTLGAVLLALVAFDAYEMARVRCNKASPGFPAHKRSRVTNQHGH